MPYKKIAFVILLLIGCGFILWIYQQYNPLDSILFPKCPIKAGTGLDCPGCGSQRALHYLLKGELKQSFRQNPLLYILVPYVVLGLYLNQGKITYNALTWRKRLYGYQAIWVLMVVIIVFTILRNIF